MRSPKRNAHKRVAAIGLRSAIIVIFILLLTAVSPVVARLPGTTETYTFSESGLSSEISSWGVTLDGQSKSTSPGSSLSFSLDVSSTTTFSWSYHGVPGYSTPSGGSSTGGSYTGTYSGSPVGPSISSVSGSPNPSDSGQSVSFSASYTYNDVNGGSASWNYANPTTFSTGTYTVTLTVSTDAGSTSKSFTQTVNSDPSVSASANKTTTDVGNPVQFSASGSGGTGSYSYKWYYEPSGGSYSQFSTAQNPSFSFSSAGTYDVYVALTDGAGYTVDSTTMSITVNGGLSASTISSSLNPSDSGQSVTFTESPSGGTTPYSYQWYQDGNAVGSNSASYSPSPALSTGSYSIYVVVSDEAGTKVQSSTFTQTVNSDPSVSISSSQNPTDTGNTVEFSSTVSGGTPGYSYSWTINGNSYTTKDVNVSFTSSGTYVADLTVTDAAGYAVSKSYSETVDSDPTVSASSNVSSADIGYPIEFSSSPSGGVGPYSYSWVLNGNQVSTAQDFSY